MGRVGYFRLWQTWLTAMIEGGMAMIWRFIKRLKELWDWIGLAWQLASVLGLKGFAVFVGGTVWAMMLRLPAPFILMAGFCTLVAAVWFAIAPLAVTALTQPKSSATRTKASPPNYSLWRNRSQIRLGDAACLFAELVPTSQNKIQPNVREFLSALVDAAKSGEMEFVFRDPESARSSAKGERERQYVDDDTKGTRQALRAFARKRLYTPQFLQDDD
jgi:hypothetical protein